jgi:hypothetical protein
VYVIDKQGTIVWARQYQIPEQPNPDDVFLALQRLR